MTIKTPTQILAEINGEIVPGVAGGITAPTVNEILVDIVNSFQPIGQANLINAGLTPVANFPTNTLLYSNGTVVEAATVGAGLGFSNGVLFSMGSGTITGGSTPVSALPAGDLLYSNGSVIQGAVVGANLTLSGGVLSATGGGGGSGSQFDTIAALEASTIPATQQVSKAVSYAKPGDTGGMDMEFIRSLPPSATVTISPSSTVSFDTTAGQNLGVNWPGNHNLPAGTPVVFAGGVPPPEVTLGTTYYVVGQGQGIGQTNACTVAGYFTIATTYANAMAGITILSSGVAASGTTTCTAPTTIIWPYHFLNYSSIIELSVVGGSLPSPLS